MRDVTSPDYVVGENIALLRTTEAFVRAKCF